MSVNIVEGIERCLKQQPAAILSENAKERPRARDISPQSGVRKRVYPIEDYTFPPILLLDRVETWLPTTMFYVEGLSKEDFKLYEYLLEIGFAAKDARHMVPRAKASIDSAAAAEGIERPRLALTGVGRDVRAARPTPAFSAAGSGQGTAVRGEAAKRNKPKAEPYERRATYNDRPDRAQNASGFLTSVWADLTRKGELYEHRLRATDGPLVAALRYEFRDDLPGLRKLLKTKSDEVTEQGRRAFGSDASPVERRKVVRNSYRLRGPEA
ncbi:hypothetical protein [Phenylobacterium sp.]|jgi:hypothetical protein|uniref:hypothetical protein n=1 Tax=Phenylobacterium sp. TaxID=1871053 RepID=UPI002F3ED971